MSFWMKSGVVIEDLECFKITCEKLGVSLEENTELAKRSRSGNDVKYTLRDPAGGTACLVHYKGGFRLEGDTDSSLLRRLRGGQEITRSYAEETIRKFARSNRMSITGRKVQEDGRIVLRACVGY